MNGNRKFVISEREKSLSILDKIVDKEAFFS